MNLESHSTVRAGSLTVVDAGTKDRHSVIEASDDMKRIKKDFSRAHAMSIHLNAISIGMTICYGFLLASRMTIA